jgi:hypothetical protein
MIKLYFIIYFTAYAKVMPVVGKIKDKTPIYNELL